MSHSLSLSKSGHHNLHQACPFFLGGTCAKSQNTIHAGVRTVTLAMGIVGEGFTAAVTI